MAEPVEKIINNITNIANGVFERMIISIPAPDSPHYWTMIAALITLLSLLVIWLFVRLHRAGRSDRDIVRGEAEITLSDVAAQAAKAGAKAAGAVMEQGAREVRALATHAVFSGPAIGRIEKSVLSSVTVTDTVPISAVADACHKIHTVSIGRLLGDAIERVHGGQSVTSLWSEHL